MGIMCFIKGKDRDLIFYLDDYMQQMFVSKMVKSKGIEIEAKGNESIRHLQKFCKKCLKSSFLLFPPICALPSLQRLL